ncbi:hypothetical protein LRS73_22335 [Methylobacterium currus]|uniref:hypothetical protein n=1 Tax=Methylobacterium currus TaxID=2051553 RepID=UPI001E5A57A7|nr:hypothetical protein [Methylobacterium currus]UHC15235.1 hypothetical protein LRS73_22335 [Methylobacterium currus]
MKDAFAVALLGLSFPAMARAEPQPPIGLRFGEDAASHGSVSLRRSPDLTAKSGGVDRNSRRDLGDLAEISVKADDVPAVQSSARHVPGPANAVDLGADPTGAADSRAAFVAAARADGRTVVIPPGTYRLGTRFEPMANVLFEARGATFTAGMFGPIGDLTAYPTHTLFKTTTTSATDSVLNVGLLAKSSDGNSSYQKSAIFARATQADPGSCTGAPLSGCKDVVGITASGNVAENIVQGRGYGANFTAQLGAGSTGVAAGYEVDVYNLTGLDHTADFYAGVGGGTRSSIVGSTVVCGGNAPCDAAYYISSQDGGRRAPFSAGLRVLRSAVRDYVLEINDDTHGNLLSRTAWIKPDGTAQVAAFTATGVATLAQGFFATSGTIVGDSALVLSSGVGAGAAQITSSAGPLVLRSEGGNGVLTSAVVRRADPRLSDVPAGQCVDWRNSSSGTLKRVCHIEGKLRSITYD